MPVRNSSLKSIVAGAAHKQDRQRDAADTLGGETCGVRFQVSGRHSSLIQYSKRNLKSKITIFKIQNRDQYLCLPRETAYRSSVFHRGS